MDVLLGREEPPTGSSVESLAEYASAVYARAGELTVMIQTAEREGRVTKGSGHYRVRTGELRTFMEISKNAYEMGSRRITLAKLEYEQEID